MIQPYYYYLERPDRIKEIDYEDLLLYMEDRPAWSEIKLLAALKQKYTYGNIDQELIHHLISTTNDKNILNRYLAIIESFPSKPESSMESDAKTISLDLESMSDVTEVSVDDNLVERIEEVNETADHSSTDIDDTEEFIADKMETESDKTIFVDDHMSEVGEDKLDTGENVDTAGNVDTEGNTSEMEEEESPYYNIDHTDDSTIDSNEINSEDFDHYPEEDINNYLGMEDQDGFPESSDPEIMASEVETWTGFEDETEDKTDDDSEVPADTTVVDESASLSVFDRNETDIEESDEAVYIDDLAHLIPGTIELTGNIIEDMGIEKTDDMEKFENEGDEITAPDLRIEYMAKANNELTEEGNMDTEPDLYSNEDRNGVEKESIDTSEYAGEYAISDDIEGFDYHIDPEESVTVEDESVSSESQYESSESMDDQYSEVSKMAEEDINLENPLMIGARDFEEIEDNEDSDGSEDDIEDGYAEESEINPVVDNVISLHSKVDTEDAEDTGDTEDTEDPEKRKKTRFEKIAAKRRKEIDKTNQDMVVDFKTWLSTLSENPETAKEWKVKKKKVKKSKISRKKLSKAEKLAAESVQVNDEVVSETLAKLYVKQGLIDRAQAMYEKLSLKYPEKSIYFAAKLKELADKKS
ncbi:hypothetical protein [Membranihabitans marinus]|uniref:hypothetical protein n=1 Tax=Membranihabitans marinus TaxID=1227546 RepID=UPI001F373D2E|nr:hypothetical protein [Membranihabitans marinus]